MKLLRGNGPEEVPLDMIWFKALESRIQLYLFDKSETKMIERAKRFYSYKTLMDEDPDSEVAIFPFATANQVLFIFNFFFELNFNNACTKRNEIQFTLVNSCLPV